MKKDRRDLGKRAIKELVEDRNRLTRNINDWMKRIDEINRDLDDVVESIIRDGDDYYV